MSDQQAFEQLKDFFETRPACRKAADPLGRDVEIGIIINETFSCAFFKRDGEPVLEAREARNPDVVFYIKPEAIGSLVENPSEDIGELGITFVKNYLAGLVRVKVKGSMISLLTGGYLGVIKGGGISFARYLAGHGVTGLSKIKDIFQRLRD